MAIPLNDNLDIQTGKLTDQRAGPYSSVALALASLPSYQRVIGLPVVISDGVNQSEYWFLNGILDTDFVERSFGAIDPVVGTSINHTVAGTIALDLDTFDIVTVTIDAEITELSFTNGAVGREYIIRMVQGTTGGVLTAVASGVNVLNGNAILLSNTSGDRDFLKVLVEASGTYFIEPTYND